MKLLSQKIIRIAALSCFLSSAYAHNMDQPTGLIAPNSSWKFDDDGVADSGWETSEFSDEAWQTATSPLGYGESDLNKPFLQKGQIDYFLRHDFTVKDRTAIRSLTLRARYDDAFVLYLNGKELTRTHPLDGSTIHFRETKVFDTFRLPSEALRNGNNTLAARLVNCNTTSSDLVFGGHSHTYERSILMQGHYGKSDTFDPDQHAVDAGNGRPESDGAYHQESHQDQGRGTIYTVAGSSGKFGPFRAPHLPFMVENLSALASVIVDIDGRSLRVTTLGSVGETLDSYTLEKD